MDGREWESAWTRESVDALSVWGCWVFGQAPFRHQPLVLPPAIALAPWIFAVLGARRGARRLTRATEPSGHLAQTGKLQGASGSITSISCSPSKPILSANNPMHQSSQASQLPNLNLGGQIHLHITTYSASPSTTPIKQIWRSSIRSLLIEHSLFMTEIDLPDSPKLS